MIIEISQPLEHSEKCFFALEDGFHMGKRHGDGHVQMCVLPYFEDPQDEFVSIDFSDNIMEREGNYLPMSFEKEDLKQLVDFLQTQYARFTS